MTRCCMVKNQVIKCRYDCNQEPKSKKKLLLDSAKVLGIKFLDF